MLKIQWINNFSISINPLKTAPLPFEKFYFLLFRNLCFNHLNKVHVKGETFYTALEMLEV